MTVTRILAKVFSVVVLLPVVLWGQAPASTAPSATDMAKEVATMRSKLADWPQLEHYRAANAALQPVAAGEQRVIIYGASVAEYWGTRGGPFFPGKPYLNRGIGGQTSSQMLVRFRQDVIHLHPAAVVFLESTNDISQNMEPQVSEDNYQSIAELAKANGIQMILTSITPSDHFLWNPGMHPAEIIRTRNAWLKEYAASHSLIYVDFFPALANADGGMKADLTIDGVHPNKEGYALMAPLVQAAIDQALGGK
ncbi:MULTISPECIES: GDSL-type esterase/lipase family protein [Acidobacteriaceae]|uniref:GDSL-type esterase/lipase family protein n=1 Tax=Acidobacteriaceae TaxID=204434 RepID=UPI00131D7051|nr:MULTISPECIES: GDSL-type esterase/lipase family protein [Acidobacteriaceae]MDW5265884.1 GDSL-type esterase/lipase family protein [Edaphobacter sp.]